MEEVKFGKKDLKKVEVVVTGKYLNSVPDADKVRYDDGDTLLGADNVQGAIEKIFDNVQVVSASCDDARSDLAKAQRDIAELDVDVDNLSNEVSRRYIKPETGIPLGDLNSGIRTSLSWANTAVQPADLRNYPTTDNVLGWIRDKQDKLLSGENIKTINGESLLGGGNINIEGGSIGDGSVVTNMLADDAVTEGKLSEDVRTKLNSGGAIDYVSEFVNGGVVNIQSIGTIEAVYNSLAKGGVALCIIGDSDGNYPSAETRVNVNEKYLQSASYLFSTEPRGANVGDLLMITKRDYVLVTVCALKIIPVNDCKLADGEYNATEGIITAWDKARINKIDGIDSHLTDTRNWLSSVNDTVERNLYRTRYPYGTQPEDMLQTGVCAYTPCKIGGLEANWTIFTECSADPDGGGFYHLKQTAVCRDDNNRGEIWMRLAYYTNNSSTWLGWQRVSKTTFDSDAMVGICSHAVIYAESGEIEINPDAEPNSVGVSCIATRTQEGETVYGSIYSSYYGGDGYYVFATDYTYTVYKDEETGKWEVEKYPTYSERFATKEELSNKVDKPSRNLLINSNLELADNLHTAQKPWSFVGGSSSSSTSISKGEYNGYNVINLKDIGLQQNVNLVEGKIYTVSLMYRAQGTSYVNYNKGLSNNATNLANIVEGSQGLQLVTSSTLQQASFTFVAKADAVFSLYANGNLSIACMQLEEGDTVTAYKRAEETYATVEEVESMINESITKVLNEDV